MYSDEDQEVSRAPGCSTAGKRGEQSFAIPVRTPRDAEHGHTSACCWACAYKPCKTDGEHCNLLPHLLRIAGWRQRWGARLSLVGVAYRTPMHDIAITSTSHRQSRQCGEVKARSRGPREHPCNLHPDNFLAVKACSLHPDARAVGSTGFQSAVSIYFSTMPPTDAWKWSYPVRSSIHAQCRSVFLSASPDGALNLLLAW